MPMTFIEGLMPPEGKPFIDEKLSAAGFGNEASRLEASHARSDTIMSCKYAQICAVRVIPCNRLGDFSCAKSTAKAVSVVEPWRWVVAYSYLSGCYRLVRAKLVRWTVLGGMILR